jgi:hypothetical protein
MSCDRAFFGFATALKSGAVKMNLCWQLSGKPSLPIDFFARLQLSHRLASLPYSKAARLKSLVRPMMALLGAAKAFLTIYPQLKPGTINKKFLTD